MSEPTPKPSLGAGILLSNGRDGWNPEALLLTSPLVLLRARAGVVTLTTPENSEPFLRRECDPIELLEDVLALIRLHLPAVGPGAGKPAFPIALVAASYEFGRSFPPHQDCFLPPSAADDEFFASIHVDAFRPDARGGTERIGYAGSIPAGWIKGGPALETSSYGHLAPMIVAHQVPPNVQARPLTALWSEEEYATRIRQIQEYLAAGDIYQANLTVPFRGATAHTPEALFDTALRRGGAAFAAMTVLPGGTLLSFSPELYLRRRGRDIETRPIKGTRPVPAWADAAAVVRENLLSSEKDRAEHLMIVDLERNDLGRICENGSIVVDPFLRVVEHPTVMHLESTVKGRLREDVTMTEIFAATFPGGSVSGAPKKRALEILRGLESAPRGLYCGAFGWVDADGDCELNLPIRTAMLRLDGEVEYNAGGGIVADSSAAAEWKELHDKAAFFQSLLESGGGRVEG